ncbi:hypothetical protein [Chromobacterium sp. IIBBL 290-4]|uniref:hypothetical protein n=1 Tax=Chromobacterium sp. IIBBL 290-4 TaxID=2953890 RepID=UPI0020B6EFC6|nr:hypothetical protein [Chromobacterium sp. IIBBL 290-4]UTH75015.1 hypothetical protein NKT35_02595 [Chromobacterium sp. IIBBL 290-4]
MKTIKLVMSGAAMLAASLFSLPSQAGVSISVGEPGFYGQIDIGGAPAPQLVYPQPVMIQPVPVAAAPIYLRVPPGHMKHWDRYCMQYHACNRRVYFVRDDWYQRVYVPHYHAHHGHPHGDPYRHEHYDEHHGDHHRDDWGR